MEKVIFFVLSIIIFIIVIYLGGSAIIKGYKAKLEKKIAEEDSSEQNDNNFSLSDELNKLNELKHKGILSDDEFEKAKKKILEK